MELNFPKKTYDKVKDKILNILENKCFYYIKFTSRNKKTIQFACTLAKNKNILDKLQFKDNILINYKLYGEFLEKNFYKCRLNKDVTHYIKINIHHNDTKNNKIYVDHFLIQQCSLVDIKRNLINIINIMTKYDLIAKKISNNLSCSISISNIHN